MLRVPGGLKWLADRVALDPLLSPPVLRGGDWIVTCIPEAVRASNGIEWIPIEALRADSLGLSDLLVRAAVSGAGAIKPLSKREFELLSEALANSGGPEWRTVVPVDMTLGGGV